MTSMNTSLINARDAKNDEFYTRQSDINDEVSHYITQLKDKTILCNCDDYRQSYFCNFFFKRFHLFKLKKLVTTCYKTRQTSLFNNVVESPVCMTYDKTGIKNRNLSTDGDFRNSESVEILKQADIVITNPPFSLFREYIDQLVKYDKKFLLIGNQNAIFYKNIFQLFKSNKLWPGNNFGKMTFDTPNKPRSLGNVCWFTNLETEKRHQELELKPYDEAKYAKYDNYDAINVDKISNIPDYDGVMGVPITFIYSYNPAQFEILGSSRYHDDSNIANDINFIDGKSLYSRILIRQKNLHAK